ncbi:hypothetical protein [Vibrio sp. MEBiC08052]|uniref:hypothetical protein n=1 Tax=Vibrio sp. MEBiC08052 TaxID=1761910 RepID=UPI0012FC5548|nr:hypothetical protein [Vibrio sp. MEBiC08052]
MMQVFGAQSLSSVSSTSPTAPQVLFHGRKSTPKCLRFGFSAPNQGRIDSHPAQAILKNPSGIFHPESIDQFGFALKMFHCSQINSPTKKTIPGEWLGFSGQDARKSRFWTTCDAVKHKKIFWFVFHL